MSMQIEFLTSLQALEIDDKSAKALYRRGQANLNMKDFEQAMVILYSFSVHIIQ